MNFMADNAAGYAEGSDAAAGGGEGVTRAFSDRLKKMTSEREQAIRGEYEPLMQALMECGLGETIEEIILALQENQENVNKAREMVRNSVYDRDLKEIKEAFPEVTASDIRELGETYLKIMAAAERAGVRLSPAAVFEAQRAGDKRKKLKLPPSTGAAGGAGLRGEKEYYSPADVDRLSEDMLDDPKVLDQVIKSMTRWKG